MKSKNLINTLLYDKPFTTVYAETFAGAKKEEFNLSV